MRSLIQLNVFLTRMSGLISLRSLVKGHWVEEAAIIVDI